MVSASDKRAVVRYSVVDGGSREPRAAQRSDDLVAVEEPLEIRVGGETFAITMRTPGMDRELTLGLLFAEGVIHGAGDLGRIAHCGRAGDEGFGNTIDALAAPGVVLDAEQFARGQRRMTVTSACGVCGRRSLDDLLERVRPVPEDERVSIAQIADAPKRLRARQPLFAGTGGLHAAAAFSRDGEMLAVAEDVGRHNAVDKVVGALLLAGERAWPTRATLLVVSGRASFEIVQKAVVAAIPAVVAISAPTTLAVDLAERANVTLVGFARDDGFNVYAHPERIVEALVP